MLKIGIVGCGTIGSFLAKYVDSELIQSAVLAALCDVDLAKAKKLSNSLRSKPPICSTQELIIRSDLVVEAASASVSGKLAVEVIKRGKDIMVMSTGGILREDRILQLAYEKGCRIYVPSGALCGLDGVKSASTGVIDEVILTTRKPPAALEGAPYIVQNNIDLSKVVGEVTIFEGSAEDAIKGFPQNVNVAAALGLAGIGTKRTKVRIVTSPGYTTNSHEVEVRGSFGRLYTRADNVPSPENPKTSMLALLSSAATLRGIVENVRIGT
jgi:aspartate dehydrogenase